MTRKVEDDELTDTLKAMVAPLRPYGCIFAYSGDAQKSLRGNYQFFEMDQNRLGGVMNQLNHTGIGEHIHCVLCGRMTPDPKKESTKGPELTHNCTLIFWLSEYLHTGGLPPTSFGRRYPNKKQH